jgi:UDP-N-acetylmuramyl tripeptide synthase
VRALKVTNDGFDRQRVLVATPVHQGEIIVPLPGLYNVYNALSAIAAAHALGLPWEPTVSGIEQFKPAFGRGERIQIDGRTVRLLLAKNPTGFNEVLRTLTHTNTKQPVTKQPVLFVLNDNIADGRDISWIWDIDFEQALESFSTLTVAGTRARDLALRLKYAGLASTQLNVVPTAALRVEDRARRAGSRQRKQAAEPTDPEESISIPVYGIAQALDQAVAQTPEGETLYVVPTYTGLLELHRELERRGLTPHYWEETGP